VHRWGPFAVTLAYLTVGVQTAVFAGAGVLRMPYLRFTLASLPGAVAWAAIWGTVGIGAVWGALSLAAGSPWGLVALGVVIAAVAAAGITATRRRATAPAETADVDDPAPTVTR
jgi:membrane protein DedA with SNARE-associated domain